MPACEICGSRDVGPLHQCSKRALQRAEARYRREEERAEADEESERSLDERLADGFKTMKEVEQ